MVSDFLPLAVTVQSSSTRSRALLDRAYMGDPSPSCTRLISTSRAVMQEVWPVTLCLHPIVCAPTVLCETAQRAAATLILMSTPLAKTVRGPEPSDTPHLTVRSRSHRQYADESPFSLAVVIFDQRQNGGHHSPCGITMSGIFRPDNRRASARAPTVPQSPRGDAPPKVPRSRNPDAGALSCCARPTAALLASGARRWPRHRGAVR